MCASHMPCGTPDLKKLVWRKTMKYKKYGVDYRTIYPEEEISDEVLDCLKKNDRKMRYMDYDLKWQRNVKEINWVVDAYIEGFFDNLNHDWLMKFLEHDIQDKKFLRYVKRFLHEADTAPCHKAQKPASRMTWERFNSENVVYHVENISYYRNLLFGFAMRTAYTYPGI
jgi:hypothetical protein